LRQYLNNRIGGRIQLKSPYHHLTSIVRGAVLHKLGVTYVKERVMRRHYGISISQQFREGHPQDLKYKALDGWRCAGVFQWYVKKGDRIPDRHIVRQTLVELLKPEAYYEGELKREINLRVYEDDKAPKYDFGDKDIPTLCSLTVDLKKIPPDAFIKKLGQFGNYYSLEYELLLTFGSTLEFQYVWQGVKIGEAIAKYD